jgi:hypothetical protein
MAKAGPAVRSLIRWSGLPILVYHDEDGANDRSGGGAPGLVHVHVPGLPVLRVHEQGGDKDTDYEQISPVTVGTEASSHIQPMSAHEERRDLKSSGSQVGAHAHTREVLMLQHSLHEGARVGPFG